MENRKKRPSDVKPEYKELLHIPPKTEEEQLQVGVGLAYDLALSQLRNGTASSQVITHFLKLGSAKEQQEVEKMKNEIELLKAKKKAIESAEEQEKRYQEVIRAMTSYAGKDSEWETIDEYPYSDV